MLIKIVEKELEEIHEKEEKEEETNAGLIESSKSDDEPKPFIDKLTDRITSVVSNAPNARPEEGGAEAHDEPEPKVGGNNNETAQKTELVQSQCVQPPVESMEVDTAGN